MMDHTFITRFKIVAHALGNNPSEESVNQTETDAVGNVPNTTRIENNREKQSTEYLTRFGNVPTSSG